MEKSVDIIDIKYNIDGFFDDLLSGLFFNLNAFIYNNRLHWLVVLPLDRKINPTAREKKYLEPSTVGKKTRTKRKRSISNKNKTKNKTKGKKGRQSKKKN